MNMLVNLSARRFSSRPRWSFSCSGGADHTYEHRMRSAPVVRKYSVRSLDSLKTRHAPLGKVRPVAWRFEPLSSGGTNRFGATTIRHNVQWAAILLPHPRGLWRLSGAQHIPAFLYSVAISSACGEPVLTEAVGLLPRTPDPTQAFDRCRSLQPCPLVQVL